MLCSFLGVLPILTPPLCALTLSCDQSPIPLLLLKTFISLPKNQAFLLTASKGHYAD
jgi:hypothetical protein